MLKAIFFDRDGTLIDEPADELVDTWDKFNLKSDLAELKKAAMLGYKIFVITNQEGIDEGTLDPEFYAATNQELFKALKEEGVFIDGIYTCPHARSGLCTCRKPKTGLINDILAKYEIDLASSYIVGDRPSDVELGKMVGTKTIFINSPKFSLPSELNPDFQTSGGLAQVIGYIISKDLTTNKK